MNTSEILYTALKATGYDVYPQKSPQNKKNPLVIYNITSDTYEYGLTCYLDNENTRFQVDIYADGYSEIKEMQTNVVAAIRGITDAKPIVYSSIDSIDEDARRVRLDIKLWT